MWVDSHVGGWTVRWVGGWTVRWVDGQSCGWMDSHVGGWVDSQVGGWMDRQVGGGQSCGWASRAIVSCGSEVGVWGGQYAGLWICVWEGECIEVVLVDNLVHCFY